MIRHIVLLRARPSVTDAQIADIFYGLAALCATLPGTTGFLGGRSDSPEKIERGYLHGFTIDFADAPALHAYAVHPEHQRLARALVAIADGPEGILVVDIPA
jgi:hypothetical protein